MLIDADGIPFGLITRFGIRLASQGLGFNPKPRRDFGREPFPLRRGCSSTGVCLRRRFPLMGFTMRRACFPPRRLC